MRLHLQNLYVKKKNLFPTTPREQHTVVVTPTPMSDRAIYCMPPLFILTCAMPMTNYKSNPRANNGYEYKARRAFDGKLGLNDRWINEASDTKPWIVADLSVPYSICGFNIAKNDFHREGFDGCSHQISVWVGTAAEATQMSLLALSPTKTNLWKPVVTSSSMDSTAIYHDDLDSDVVSQYVRFDFDVETCSSRKDTYNRVFELEVLGVTPKVTSTTATTTTSTYTADPNIGALEQKLADLQELLKDGGTSSDDLVAEITLIKEALLAADAAIVQDRERVNTKFTELADGYVILDFPFVHFPFFFCFCSRRGIEILFRVRLVVLSRLQSAPQCNSTYHYLSADVHTAEQRGKKTKQKTPPHVSVLKVEYG